MQMVDYGVHKLWDYNNVGVIYWNYFTILPMPPSFLIMLSIRLSWCDQKVGIGKFLAFVCRKQLLFNTLIRVGNNIAIGKGIDIGIYNFMITRWTKFYWHLFDYLSIYSCKPRVSVPDSSPMWTCHGRTSMLHRYGYNTIQIWWYGNF